jgi:hypothetical protein
VSALLGINDFVTSKKSLFIVHPNPSNGLLNIKSSFDGNFTLFISLGQVIKVFNVVSTV